MLRSEENEGVRKKPGFRSRCNTCLRSLKELAPKSIRNLLIEFFAVLHVRSQRLLNHPYAQISFSVGLLLISIFSVVFVGRFASRGDGSDRERLGFRDVNGLECGASPRTSDFPFLYFPPKNIESPALDYDHGICVQRCPTAWDCQNGLELLTDFVDLYPFYLQTSTTADGFNASINPNLEFSKTPISLKNVDAICYPSYSRLTSAQVCLPLNAEAPLSLGVRLWLLLLEMGKMRNLAVTRASVLVTLLAGVVASVLYLPYSLRSGSNGSTDVGDKSQWDEHTKRRRRLIRSALVFGVLPAFVTTFYICATLSLIASTPTPTPELADLVKGVAWSTVAGFFASTHLVVLSLGLAITAYKFRGRLDLVCAGVNAASGFLFRSENLKGLEFLAITFVFFVALLGVLSLPLNIFNSTGLTYSPHQPLHTSHPNTLTDTLTDKLTDTLSGAVFQSQALSPSPSSAHSRLLQAAPDSFASMGVAHFREKSLRPSSKGEEFAERARAAASEAPPALIAPLLEWHQDLIERRNSAGYSHGHDEFKGSDEHPEIIRENVPSERREWSEEGSAAKGGKDKAHVPFQDPSDSFIAENPADSDANAGSDLVGSHAAPHTVHAALDGGVHDVGHGDKVVAGSAVDHIVDISDAIRTWEKRSIIIGEALSTGFLLRLGLFLALILAGVEVVLAVSRHFIAAWAAVSVLLAHPSTGSTVRPEAQVSSSDLEEIPNYTEGKRVLSTSISTSINKALRKGQLQVAERTVQVSCHSATSILRSAATSFFSRPLLMAADPFYKLTGLSSRQTPSSTPSPVADSYHRAWWQEAAILSQVIAQKVCLDALRAIESGDRSLPHTSPTKWPSFYTYPSPSHSSPSYPSTQSQFHTQLHPPTHTDTLDANVQTESTDWMIRSGRGRGSLSSNGEEEDAQLSSQPHRITNLDRAVMDVLSIGSSIALKPISMSFAIFAILLSLALSLLQSPSPLPRTSIVDGVDAAAAAAESGSGMFLPAVAVGFGQRIGLAMPTALMAGVATHYCLCVFFEGFEQVADVIAFLFRHNRCKTAAASESLLPLTPDLNAVARIHASPHPRRRVSDSLSNNASNNAATPMVPRNRLSFPEAKGEAEAELQGGADDDELARANMGSRNQGLDIPEDWSANFGEDATIDDETTLERERLGTAAGDESVGQNESVFSFQKIEGRPKRSQEDIGNDWASPPSSNV